MRPARARRLLPAALVVAAVLGAWELLARLTGVDDYVLPAPSEIARALADDRSLLWSNGLVTLEEVVLGLAIAIAAGLACALALHLSGTLRAALYPFLVASQAVPVVVLAPILAVALGYGLGPKLVVVALVCFFPVAVNALDGLRSADPERARMLRTLGAGRRELLVRDEAPGALPSTFSGVKVAASVAVIGAVFAEWSGSDAGLGHLIIQAIPQFETARVFAAVVVLSLFAVTLFALTAALERALVPWARPGRPRA